jgi:hypothetical protein
VAYVHSNLLAIAMLDIFSSMYRRFNSFMLGFNGFGHPFGCRSIPYRLNHRLTVVDPTPKLAAMAGVDRCSSQYILRKSSALGGVISFPMKEIYNFHGTLSMTSILGGA